MVLPETEGRAFCRGAGELKAPLPPTPRRPAHSTAQELRARPPCVQGRLGPQPVAGMGHFWSWSWVACVWGHGVRAGRRRCFFSGSWETASVLHTAGFLTGGSPSPHGQAPSREATGCRVPLSPGMGPCLSLPLAG